MILVALFSKYPPKSYDVNEIVFEDIQLRKLVIYAKAMAMLRAFFTFKEGTDDYDDRYGKPQREKEERAIIILKNIALGSALIHGRDYVNDYDISQIKHICLSSMPEPRRIIFEALLTFNGFADTNTIMKHTKFSNPTALHYMKELGHLGICNYEGSPDGDTSSIELKDTFDELLEGDISKNEEELHKYFDN